MKPLRLKMLGIGPYANIVDLDFYKLNDEGLFLITGATGAGKTSIFDGITYALYGKTNFDNKEKKDSIICDHIKLCDKKNSYVEFIFSIGKIEYRIKRVPPYPYINRNNISDKTSEYVEIEFQDQLINSKTKVDKMVINEIIKLDYNQFKKIIMLAQGAFSEFITSNSAKKSEILKQIFDTTVYEKISFKLKEKLEKNRAIINNNKEVILALSETLDIDSDEWKELLKKEKFNFDALLIQINLEKDKLKIAIDSGEKEAGKINIDDIIKNIEKSKIINDGIDNLERAEAEKIQLDKEKINIKEKREKIILYNRAIKISGDYKINLNIQDELKTKNKKNIKDEEELKNLQKINNKEITKLDKYKEQLENISDQKTKINTLKTDIEIYNNSRLSLKDFKDKFSRAEKKAVSYKRDIAVISDRIIELNLKEEKIKKELIAREGISKEIETLKHKLSELEPILNEFNTLDRYDVDLKQKKNELETLELKRMKSFNIYNISYQEWIQSGAYKISEKLIKGVPCPVCGSKEHPEIATKPSGTPTELEINEYKKEYDSYNDRYQNKTGKLKALEDNIGSIKNKIMKLTGKNSFYYGDKESLSLMIDKSRHKLNTYILNYSELSKLKDFEKLEVDKKNMELEENRITKEKNSNDQEMSALKVEIKSNKKTILEIEEKFEKHNISITDYQDNLKKLIINIQNLTDKIHDIEKIEKEITEKTIQLNSSRSDIENIEKIFRQNKLEWVYLLKENQFLNTEEYKTALDIDESQIQKDIELYNEKLTKIKTLKETNIKYQNMKKIDILALEKEKTDKNNKIIEINKLISNKIFILNCLKKIKTKLENSIDLLKIKECEYNILNKLYEISVGKYGDNGNSINFQNYVLATYFQDILDRANERFIIMSNHQYKMILDRKKKGSAGSGLEVNIFDSHTGKERSIKTLSGGEIFKASMALALGLSDVVQAQNGGIKLDSIFIDEGFGTLDEESLSTAMDVLIELKSSGRTVGIISHVNEIKQLITSQIRVEKTIAGSTAEVIC